MLTLPLLKAVGAEVVWMGTHVTSFPGEPRAEELLVVRCPNQRRFFALALNPYYMLVANPQRMKAVRKFEASFTQRRRFSSTGGCGERMPYLLRSENCCASETSSRGPRVP